MNLSFPDKPYLEDNCLILVSNWKLLFARLNLKSSSIVVMDTLKVTNLNWIRDQKSQLVRSEVNVQEVKANIDLWSIVMIPGGFIWRLHPIYMTLGRGRCVVLPVNNGFLGKLTLYYSTAVEQRTLIKILNLKKMCI